MSLTANYETLKRRSASSMVAIGVRQVIGQGLNILGNIVLARLLSPAEFGTYALLQFVGSLLMTLVGSGLGASLVRQREEPTTDDFRVVALMQLVLSLLFAVILVGASPFLIEIYQIKTHGSIGLFAVAGLAYAVLAFQTVPQARLERELNFRTIAFIELSQIVTFNAALIAAALGGLGGLSFVAGILVRAVVGAIGFQIARPSPLGKRGFDWRLAKRHLSFGIPFQGVNIVSALKDSIVPLFIATALGADAVGFINWASMVAVYPVLILMIVSRVYLPTFSRMQGSPEQLGRFLSTVLHASYMLVAPQAIATLVLIEPITRLVFGTQWEPAQPLFYLLWLANLVVPVTTALLAFLNAAGNVRAAVQFACICFIGTWLLGVPMVKVWGALGYASVNALVQLATLFLWWKARQVAPFKFFFASAACWLMASGAGLVVWGVQLFHSPSSMIELVGFLALFFFLYAVIAFAVMREKVGAIITLFGLEKFLRFLPVPEFLSRVLKLQNSGRREP